LNRDKAKKIGDVAKEEDPSKDFQKAKQNILFSMLASKYLEIYARN